MKNKKNLTTLERAYGIIKKPITTEKSTNLQQFNQYTFEVLRDSTSQYMPQSCKGRIVR